MPLPSAPPARPSHRRPVLRLPLAYDYAPIARGAAAPGRLPRTYAYDARLSRRSRRSAFHLASDCSSADCASLLPRRSAAVPGRGTPGLTYVPGLAAFDGNGNVRALVKADAANPAASGIVERYAYDGFGRELPVSLVYSPSSPVPVNSFRFSTKQLDVETGMNYYGYRFYAAGAGRWINRDPAGEDASSNVYIMVENGAANYFDVNGLRVGSGEIKQPGIIDIANPNAVAQTDPGSGFSISMSQSDVKTKCPTGGCKVKLSASGSFSVSIGYSSKFFKKNQAGTVVETGIYTYTLVKAHEEKHASLWLTGWNLAASYANAFDGNEYCPRCATAIIAEVNAHTAAKQAASWYENVRYDYTGASAGHNTTKKDHDTALAKSQAAYATYSNKLRERIAACK